jgi:hypothetical protein
MPNDNGVWVKMGSLTGDSGVWIKTTSTRNAEFTSPEISEVVE